MIVSKENVTGRNPLQKELDKEAFDGIESKLKHWVDQLFVGHGSLNEITEEQVQEMHLFAYLLYRDQRYQEASYFFRLLVVARPTEAKYWKGLGACLQVLKAYEEALSCYMCWQMTTRDQPNSYLYVHVADCYFALKQVPAGLRALEAANLIAEKTHQPHVIQHVTFMRQIWSQPSS